MRNQVTNEHLKGFEDWGYRDFKEGRGKPAQLNSRWTGGLP
jgi:hypothetical protein